jgi:hypothetical protein
VSCLGIESPICEGDNLEFEGIVYHIESVNHSCAIDPGSGMRHWATTLTLTNGLRAEDSHTGTSGTGGTNNGGGTPSDTNPDFPIYPGFRQDDNTSIDPGTSIEDERQKFESSSEKKQEKPPFDAGTSAGGDDTRIA